MEGEKSMFLGAKESSGAQTGPCLSCIPPAPLPGSIGGGVKCADARNWLSGQEEVLRILIGVTLLALAATAQCPRGTALLWDSTFHSLS